MVPESSAQLRAATRAEALWVVGLTCVAGVLRFAHLQSLSLTHFDEGVYALWGMFADYPAKEFYAPPLFPWLVGRVYWLIGTSDLGAMAISGAFGTASVPAAWWVARSWYGATAGVAGAALAAFSGLHIAFSRLALTDAMFTFWFVFAAAWIARSVFRTRVGTSHLASQVDRIPLWIGSLSAGLATAAAMNTKYNGLLLLCFAGIGLIWWTLFQPHQRGQILRHSLPVFVAISVVALLAYLPWFWHVETRVGYRALLAHQHGYSSGLACWWDNLLTMLANQWFLGRGTGFVGPVVGLLAALANSGRGIRLREGILIGCIAAASLILGDALGWLIGTAVILSECRLARPTRLFHAVLLLGLLVLTPLYHPYARLMMPLVAAGWIGTGRLLELLVDRLPKPRSPNDAGRSWIFAWITCLSGAGVTYFVHTVPGRSHAEHSGLDLSAACSFVQSLLPRDERVAAYVRPPVLFYLLGSLDRLDPADEAAWERVARGATGHEYLLVDRALLRDNPSLADHLGRSVGTLQEVTHVSYRPSLPVLLDDFGRSYLRRGTEQQVTDTYQLVLYRITGLP